MIRLIIYIALSLIISAGAAWLITLEGTITIDFAGYRMQPSLGATALALIALIIISIFIWAIIRRFIEAPKRLAKFNLQQKKNKGIQALSNGFIALQAGDAISALKFAKNAKAQLVENDAAKLLQARAELALGNLTQAREHYRALISDQKTAPAALTGLYDQAMAQNREDIAITFAKKTHEISPSSEWASDAVFRDLVKNSDYEKALTMIATKKAKSQAEIDKLRRQKTILHTAIATSEETKNPDKALMQAKLALKLDPNFIPAALIGARIMSNKNQIRKSSSLLRRVFNATSHPHLATLYANVQPGSSAVEKLKKTTDIIGESPSDVNLAIVLAQAAINAFEWDKARKTLSDFTNPPSQNVCVLMAQIEEGQEGDQGKAREWLAKAVKAQADPTWVANGITSDHWEAISPLDGSLDAFKWEIPKSTIAIAKSEAKPTPVEQDNQNKKTEPLTIAP